jgi:hypothetical protein
MANSQRLPDNHPIIVAWEEYKKRMCIKGPDRTLGALWTAYSDGWMDAEKHPSNTATAPEIQHVLSRNQRDALVAANVLLAVMQAADETMFNRIQGVVDEISDMLYG